MIKKPLILLTIFPFIFLPTLSNALEIIDSSNITDVVKIARNYGSATLSTQPNGNPKIIGKIDNIPYIIRFRNCMDQTQCEDMNFRVGFLIKPDASIINNWNKAKRFSKAYLDDDNDAILEWDVILYGGITKENMDRSFSYWRLTLAQFTSHIGFK